MNKKINKLLALSLIAGTIGFGGINTYAYESTTENIQADYNDKSSDVIDAASLKVSNTEVKPGDKIKITFKTIENSENIQLVMVQYIKPISKKLQTLTFQYNKETGLYEGEITITDKTESGNWKMPRILIQCKDGSFEEVFNKKIVIGENNSIDLSAADFKVSGTKVLTKNDVDLGAPKIDLSILKNR